jgi:hypothetical protein
VAIAPPSDIVLGVALAADPDRYRVAAERLQRMGRAADADAQSSAWQSRVLPQVAHEPAPGGSRAGMQLANIQVAARQTRATPDAFGQLEAFVLQTFIQAMLPKGAAHVFGKGTAGEVWKSMMAEHLAKEIAGSGQVGIAKRLQSTAVSGGSITGMPGAAAVPSSPALASVLPYLQERPELSTNAEKVSS